MSDVVVLIDRQQGGEAHLASKARAAQQASKAGAVLQQQQRLADTPRRGASAHQGLKLHAALPITLMLDVLVAHGKVTTDVAASVRAFIAANQTAVPASAAAVTGTAAAAAPPAAAKPKRMAYGARAALAGNAAGRALLDTMERKLSNLCVAADVPTAAGVLALADAIGACGADVACVHCVRTHTWRLACTAMRRDV